MNKNYKNMEAFAEKFKELIDKYKEKVISRPDGDGIIECEEIRKDDKKILKHLLIVKVTKGFWRSVPPEEFQDKIEDNNWVADYFLRDEGKKILYDALEIYYKDADKQQDNLDKFLFRKVENNNMKKWIEMALNNENIRKNVLGGYKSWRIFLRDAYDFKFIPIDFHERRFIVRTGIFNYYLGAEVHDPDPKEHHYEIALKKFAQDFLSDKTIKGYNLGENSGLVDKFIWIHCADEKICAKEPKCNECVLRDVCVRSIHLHR